MRMLRMLATAAVATLTGLAMAGTAHAEEEMPTRPYAVHEVDGCEVTVHVTSPDEWRDGSARTWPVMLVVDAGDQVDVLTVEPGESATAGPYGLTATTVAYRIFGTAERDDDSPAWDADRDTIAAHIAAHGDDWVTGGIADVPAWVGWHTIAADGCEPVDEPTPAPTGEPTTEPTAEPTDDPGAGAGGSDDDTLPVTSGLVMPVVLGGAGLAAVAVGGVALAVGRRRGLPLD